MLKIYLTILSEGESQQKISEYSRTEKPIWEISCKHYESLGIYVQGLLQVNFSFWYCWYYWSKVSTFNKLNSRAGYHDKLCTLSVWLPARSADADQSKASLKNGAILIGLEIECCVSDISNHQDKFTTCQ